MPQGTDERTFLNKYPTLFFLFDTPCSFQDEENDILIKGFSALKDFLNSIEDLRSLDPLHFLGKFDLSFISSFV